MCGEFAERTSTSTRSTASILPVAPNRRVLVVVVHPDDETLWAGGTMLMRPNWSWRVVSVCRGNDDDRRPKFFAAVERLGGSGSIGDVDDAPEQRPLPDSLVQDAIVSQLDTAGFDLMVTHSPFGEYTRHIRHEEVGRAVLWGHVPHLVLHPRRCGVQPIPWLVADGYVANYHEQLEALPLVL